MLSFARIFYFILYRNLNFLFCNLVCVYAYKLCEEMRTATMPMTPAWTCAHGHRMIPHSNKTSRHINIRNSSDP